MQPGLQITGMNRSECIAQRRGRSLPPHGEFQSSSLCTPYFPELAGLTKSFGVID